MASRQNNQNNQNQQGQVKNPETDGRLKENQSGGTYQQENGAGNSGASSSQQTQQQSNDSSSDRGTGEPRDGRDRNQTNQSQNNQRQANQNQQNQQSPGTDENGYPLNQDGTRDERHYDHGQGDVINPETDGRLKENRGTANNQQNQQNTRS